MVFTGVHAQPPPDYYLVWAGECPAGSHSDVHAIFTAASWSPSTTTACVHCGAKPSVLVDH